MRGDKAASEIDRNVHSEEDKNLAKKTLPGKYKPNCQTYCLYREFPENLPSPLMRRWEGLHDRMVKRIDGGYHVLFDAPSQTTAGRIKQKQYLRQTAYRDILHNALKKQIRPRTEEIVKESKEDEELKTKVTQLEIEVGNIATMPTIEKAYRDYTGCRKHYGKKPSVRATADSKGSVSSKKGFVEPNAAKKEFVEIAKELTRFEERLIKCVENLWSAVGPLIIEFDDEEKKEKLNAIYKELLDNMRIQQAEVERMVYEGKLEISELENHLAAQLERENKWTYDNLKKALEKQASYARDQLLSFYKTTTNYEIQWFQPESIERFYESMRVFTHSCVRWMLIMEQNENYSKMTKAQLVLEDAQLIKDVQESEGRRIAHSLNLLNRDHETIESNIAEILFRHDTAITRLQDQIKDLVKKASQWKNISKELTNQFEKFITFTLEGHSYQTQYLLGMNGLYDRLLEDFLEVEEKAADKVRIKAEREQMLKKHREVFGPLDRLSRETSSSASTIDASRDTPSGKSMMEKQLTARARDALDFIATGKLITRRNSEDGLQLLKRREADAVLATFGYGETEGESSDSDEATGALLAEVSANSSLKNSSKTNCPDDATMIKINEIINAVSNNPMIKKLLFNL